MLGWICLFYVCLFLFVWSYVLFVCLFVCLIHLFGCLLLITFSLFEDMVKQCKSMHCMSHDWETVKTVAHETVRHMT